MSTSKFRVVGREIQFFCHNDVAWRAIHDATKIKHPQAFFLKRKNPKSPFWKKWDGCIKMVDRDWTVPGVYSCKLGLYQRLVESEAPFLEGLMDFLRPHLKPDNTTPFKQLLNGKTLSPPQEEVCKLLLANKIASVQFKTGSGKTEVMINASACQISYQPDSVFLILVPRVNLLKQTHSRFVSGAVDGILSVGMAGDSIHDVSGHNVVIATPHTIASATSLEISSFLSRVTHVIVDEGHHQAAGLWTKATSLCPEACLWGLSGRLSFDRASNRHKELALEAEFGPLLLESEAPERRCKVILKVHNNRAWSPIQTNLLGTVRDGVKAAFKFPNSDAWVYGVYHGLDENGRPNKMCMTPDRKTNALKVDKKKFGVYAKGASGRMELVPKDAMEPGTLVYQTAHDIGIMEYAPRNQWASALAASFSAKAEPWLITVAKIRHVAKLSALLKELGVKFDVVHGDQRSSRENQEAIDRFTRGEVSGLVAIYQTMSEGIDIPKLLHLIKLDGQSGEQVLTQQDGRVARSSEGKEAGYIHIPLDHHSKQLLKTTRRVTAYFKDSLGATIDKVLA